MKIAHLRHGLVALALTCLSVTLVSAEQIYIRNRPFKGTVTRAEGDYWLELQPLAQAFGSYLIASPQGGMLLAQAPPAEGETSEVPGGQLQIGTELIAMPTFDGSPRVGLQAFAVAMGAKVIVNKQLKTVDVSIPTPIQAVASSSRGNAPAPSGNVLRIQGKIRLPGCNQVGLFENGGASTPYKVGTVDGRGNYSIDIDLDKDMHPYQKGVKITDMRFFRNGAFDEAHGRCNFVYKIGSRLKLQVYGGPTYDITGKVFDYTEGN